MGWRCKESNVRIKIISSFPAAGGALSSWGIIQSGQLLEGRISTTMLQEGRSVICS